jgi:acyl-CoA hydrolase
VALDENDKPIDVPAVKPETADQKRRFENAEIRREGRLETRKKLKEH